MKKFKHITFNPSQLFIVVFSVFIFLGTLLLKLPVSTTGVISWIDALFTAISAMTVTGLVVVDKGTGFIRFGQPFNQRSPGPPYEVRQ
ncbi:hypothetical protein [Salinicoccus luteus]|uniref:hypothetical protein n=1 Tax=Salinicoccus luteus TaxID=367840 RepID=UPI0004E25602